jgi:hypothetical protein
MNAETKSESRPCVMHVTLDDIVNGLTACICCDEPDSNKKRAETYYWLKELASWVQQGQR